jgi:hypothetical protein
MPVVEAVANFIIRRCRAFGIRSVFDDPGTVRTPSSSP